MHKLVIKPDRPLLLRILPAIILLVVVGLLLNKQFWLFARHLLSSHEQSRALQHTSDQLSDERDTLSQKVTYLERQNQIQAMTAAELQKEIKSLQNNVYKLKKELEFYQGIMTSTRDTNGLSIQGLQIQPLKKTHHYHFKLILTHVKKNDKLIEGKVDMAVEGVHNNKVLTLDTQEVATNSVSDLNFEFKNFERIDGSLVLPEDFEPLHIIVYLRVKGKSSAIKRRFDWLKVHST